jgi:hypothetical protein
MKKILFIGLFACLFSCNGVEDVRNVKVGMSTVELKYFLGNPNNIYVAPGYERWYYKYFSGIRDNSLEVIVIGDKVTNFTAY